MGNNADRMLTLKVNLSGTCPRIWRQLQVPLKAALHQLHMILQVAMGWEDLHFYDFKISGRCYSGPYYGVEEEAHPLRTVRLSELSLSPGKSFSYEYDHCWLHRLEVVSTDESSEKPLPECTDGQRSCPPEHCEGVSEYRHILGVLADPDHPDHQKTSSWLGEDFEPEHFDGDLVNQKLAWYWTNRDPSRSEMNLETLCDLFLRFIQDEVTQLTWNRCRTDMSTFTQYANFVGPILFPVDSYLVAKRNLRFTEITTGLPLLRTLTPYFSYYLLLRNAASAAKIRDNSATLRRFIGLLGQSAGMPYEEIDREQQNIKDLAQMTLQLFEEGWQSLEYQDLDTAQASSSEGYFHTGTIRDDRLNLVNIRSGETLKNVIAPAETIRELNEGEPIRAEVTEKGSSRYLTGLLTASAAGLKQLALTLDSKEQRREP